MDIWFSEGVIHRDTEPAASATPQLGQVYSHNEERREVELEPLESNLKNMFKMNIFQIFCFPLSELMTFLVYLVAILTVNFK